MGRRPGRGGMLHGTDRLRAPGAAASGSTSTLATCTLSASPGIQYSARGAYLPVRTRRQAPIGAQISSPARNPRRSVGEILKVHSLKIKTAHPSGQCF